MERREHSSNDLSEYKGKILSDNELNDFREESIRLGKRFLVESGALEILDRMKEEIEAESSDVNYPSETRYANAFKSSSYAPNPGSKFTVWSSGTVSLELDWNYRKESKVNESTAKRARIHDSFAVIAQPVSGDLVVCGQVNELIPQAIWSNVEEGKNVLEAAIRRAYNNPNIQGDPIYY